MNNKRPYWVFTEETIRYLKEWYGDELTQEKITEVERELNNPRLNNEPTKIINGKRYRVTSYIEEL